MIPEDPNETAALARLARLARGEKADPYAPFEDPPTFDQQRAAAAQYLEMKRAIDARTIREQDFALGTDKQKHDQMMEEERLKLEIAKLEASLRAERERVSLEFAKLEIQKAEVIVRAIEAASKNPDASRLVEVAQAMSTRLLGGEPLPALQIEEKKD